jgi:hypothetical protein
MHQPKTTVTGKDLEGKKVTLVSTQPLQLCLFQYFYQNDEQRYSNVIELYDAAPKYFSSAKHMDMMRKDGVYLPTLERNFKYRTSKSKQYDNYILEIRPARIKRDGKEIECYPSEREEIIEEALRKIALDSSKGFYLSEKAGVEFTLYELRQELKRLGHEMRLDTIIEALTVCNRVNITIKTADEKSLLSSPIFPTLLISNRQDWLNDPKSTRCYVQFNALITTAIDSISYRQHDYVKWMGYKKQLTRWLHKKLFYNYINAGVGQSYNILASTIIRDSGLVNNTQFRDKIKAIDSALEELQENEIITKFDKNTIQEGKKITDVRYELTASWKFIHDMKLGNKRQLQIQEQAQIIGYTAQS